MARNSGVEKWKTWGGKVEQTKVKTKADVAQNVGR